jgi:hypothetical protein
MARDSVHSNFKHVKCLECETSWTIYDFKILQPPEEQFDKSKLEKWRKERKWWVCPVGCGGELNLSNNLLVGHSKSK